MRILSAEELSPELADQWGSLVASDSDEPLDRARFARARALGVPLADYSGVLAVSPDAVLAQVMVGYHRLTTARDSETVAGIADVVTRPDALRRGFSAELLGEVHRREKRLGHRLALLWTKRSWGAHRLYEKLGYRDVYSPPTAVHPPSAHSVPKRSPGISLRTARAVDAPELEALLTRSNRGGVGFASRFRHSFQTRFRLGWRRPADHHLVWRGGSRLGYFAASENPRYLWVTEVVATRPEHREPVLDAIQQYARRRWVTFGYTTFVRDAEPLFRARGFTVSPESHSTLMARSLTGSPTGRTGELRRLARDRRFVCQRGDMF